MSPSPANGGGGGVGGGGGGGFGSGPSSTTSSSSSSIIRLRVLAASTGMCYMISLHPNELSVANIRNRLSTALPIDDQILLLGPPYKVPKDSLLRTNETISALRLGDEEDDAFGTAFRDQQVGEGGSTDIGESSSSSSNEKRRIINLGPTERTGSKRLFLFSKRALSESAPDPPICTLDPGPEPFVMPTESDITIPSQHTQETKETKSTPLRMALEVYQRQFLLDVTKGRIYSNGADARLAACRNCISEQAVIAQALRAAVSNLADHRSGAARERSSFGGEYADVASGHGNLLRRFDARLEWKGGERGESGESEREGDGVGGVGGVVVAGSSKNDSLGNIALHPALVSAARSAGRLMESLLDAVPLERERAWASKCRMAHERLSVSFQELDSAFGAALGTSASWNDEVRGDLAAEESIKKLFAEIEDVGIRIRIAQADRLAILTSNHTDATRILEAALKKESEKEGDAVGRAGANSAFPTLEAMAQSSESIIPSMEADDAVLTDLSKRVAEAKTDAMKRMRSRLRQISIAQSAIARANSSVTVLRHALAQQKADMEHLEHVVELPKSYNDFLTEVRRRRAYCAAFVSNTAAMIERLNAMRSDEVKLREKFLRGPGRHLMPAFFEIFAPTLATSPPVFSPPLPDMVELDSLPDVGDESVQGASSSLESRNMDSGAEDAQANSASTLTDCPSLRQANAANAKSEMDIETTEKGGASADAQRKMNVSIAENPSLIVSADDHSGNDVIMHTVCQEDSAARRAEERADYATLMYENSVLRQALERAGGTLPHSYVNKKSNQIGIGHQKWLEEQLKEKVEKVSSMELELTEMRSQLEKARSEAQRLKKSQEEQNVSKIRDDKISHTSFNVGDVGLFMPTGRGREGKRIYLAFHSNCPHRYLSPDCINGSPDFVMGRIVYQEEMIAGALDSNTNLFGLHPGTRFWVLTVETLKKG